MSSTMEIVKEQQQHAFFDSSCYWIIYIEKCNRNLTIHAEQLSMQNLSTWPTHMKSKLRIVSERYPGRLV